MASRASDKDSGAPRILPRYQDLADGNAWGVFGVDDQLGTISLLTPERVLAAAALVRRGVVFNLDLPMHMPSRPFGRIRRHPKQSIFELRGGKGLDERLEFYPQFSSQWDGLAHASYDGQTFYNGVRRSEITGGPGSKLGIDAWARHGIVGRGVLLDVARYCERELGTPIDPTSRFLITVDLLERTAASQRVTFQEADILMVRTGVAAHILMQDDTAGEPLPDGFQVPGLESSERTVEWIWDMHFAAITADNMAVEAWPFDSEDNFMHATLLPRLGVALGELFNYEELAADCEADGRYDCMFVASPLNLAGGIGSPANALAIK